MKNSLKVFCLIFALLLPVAGYAQRQIKRPVNSTPSQESKNTNPIRSKTAGRYKVKVQSSKQGYVDLGLPSGTLWNENNEHCVMCSFDYAKKKYGSNLPSKEQWEELQNNCTWEWTGNGYKVSGNNGKFIMLPAEGYIHYSNEKLLCEDGAYGYYWSSTSTSFGEAWYLFFSSDGWGTNSDDSRSMFSVRLVQHK
jgi:uncharacterized protein (TIGR02145 family)